MRILFLFLCMGLLAMEDEIKEEDFCQYYKFRPAPVKCIAFRWHTYQGIPCKKNDSIIATFYHCFVKNCECKGNGFLIPEDHSFIHASTNIDYLMEKLTQALN